MHGMHGDLREEFDGASDAWKRRLIDEFLKGERRRREAHEGSEGVELGKKMDRGAEGGGVVAFVFRCV
jgi:hypothetical protein